MDLARHCILCDNQIIDFKKGTICKLTNKKPEFNKTCIKIELNQKFEDRIKKVNIEYENVKRTKTDTYGHVVLYTLISLAIMYAGFYLGKYVEYRGIIGIVLPIGIFGTGLTLIPFAFGPLNKYKNELSLAKNNKDKLDEVLRLYNIDYEIDLKYGKVIHNHVEVQVDLKFHKGVKS